MPTKKLETERKPASSLREGEKCRCGGTIRKVFNHQDGHCNGTGYWIGCSKLCRVVHVKVKKTGRDRLQKVFYEKDKVPPQVREDLMA